MKFLADECCDAALVEALRADSHDVLYAVESLRGAPDEALIARAVAENRVVLTEDKDFGELVLPSPDACIRDDPVAVSRERPGSQNSRSPETIETVRGPAARDLCGSGSPQGSHPPFTESRSLK